MAKSKLLPELLNHLAWPAVDENQLADDVKVRFIKLRDAIQARLGGMATWDVCLRFGISRQQLSYYINRCVDRHPDGRLRGWRALVLSDQRESYVRTAKVVVGPKGGGLAGAFEQLLEACPKAAAWLHRRLRPDDGTRFQPAGVVVADIHQQFLTRIRKEGRGTDQYPFSVEGKPFEGRGYAALCRHIRKLIAQGDDEAARAKYSDTAVEGFRRNSGKRSLFDPVISFERIAYDEWKLPSIATITIVVAGREKAIAISRLWLCLLVCFRSGAVLGYAVAVRGSFGQFELLAAVNCAISPPKPLKHPAFKDLEPLPDEGLPAAVLPVARGRRLCCLVVDNHLSHLGDRVLNDLRRRTGASVSFGMVHSWIERAVVEALFSILTKEMVKLPSTTASGPKHPAVRKPVEQAVRYNVQLDGVLALIDQLVRRHNAHRQSSLMAATPNEVIASDFAEGCRLDIVPKYPEAFVNDPGLTVEVEYHTVRGNRAKGRRPYIELDGVQYTNRVLEQSWSLVGKRLMVHIRGDYRTVKAFREDGSEFGPLSVSGRWAKSPHTRQMRKEINRLERQNILNRRAANPVANYNDWLAREAVKKQRGKRPKITKEGTDLAESIFATGSAAGAPGFTYRTQPPPKRRTFVPPRPRSPSEDAE